MTMLRDAMLQENWVDDRPPKGWFRDSISDPLYRWWEGVDTDKDGFSLVTVALADLVSIRTRMFMGTWIDTRGAKAQDPNWVAAFNDKASLLLQKYPNPVPAFTESGLKTQKT